MSPASTAALKDRFAGCLLGLAVGDALGAPYEGLTSQDIYFRFGLPGAIVGNPSGETLYYTDDTQMMIGVAETLCEAGRVEGDALMRAFVANYQPERGYGRGARTILETAATGGDWRAAAQTIFPGGSLGNGAAMRVAPVGLLFHDDPDELWAEAKRSARPTHTHPVGIEGAQILASAVGHAVRCETFDRKAFWKEMVGRVRTEEFRWAVRTAARLRRGDTVSGLGSTLLAHQSVVTAMACFADTPADYELAVGRAISLGDDTDTLAAMTGALVGAFAGAAAVPPKLVEQLEDTGKGRSYILGLTDRLFDRFRERGKAS